MIRARELRSVAIGVMMALVLSACSGSQVPAKQALEEVQSAVAAVTPQAQKYLPDQCVALQARATALRESFDKGDFKQVLADAPGLINEAQALGAAAAAKKDNLMKTLAVQWSALSASIPDMLAAVQARIDTFGKSKKQPAGIDLPAAKAGMAEAPDLWSKAQEAFTAGDMETAVSKAREAQGRIEAAAAALKLSLPAANAH